MASQIVQSSIKSEDSLVFSRALRSFNVNEIIKFTSLIVLTSNVYNFFFYILSRQLLSLLYSDKLYVQSFLIYTSINVLFKFAQNIDEPSGTYLFRLILFAETTEKYLFNPNDITTSYMFMFGTNLMKNLHDFPS